MRFCLPVESPARTRLLYYCPNTVGGLADYAHEQVSAMATEGAEVELLTASAWTGVSPSTYRVSRDLVEAKPSTPEPHSIRRMRFALSILRNIACLAARISAGNYQHVLLGTYTEYLAPFWAARLRRLAAQGVVFGAVVHDPIRDYVVGPAAWHRRSVAAGYSFLREAFVHEAIELDTIRAVPRLRTTIIPHGLYRFPAARRSREAARTAFGLPPDAKVMLSFGHIRDGKNLDLVLQAMPAHSKCHLLVAGNTPSGGQRPLAFYEQLARSLGVAHRCHWHARHVPADEVGDYFAAADLVLLTYSRRFRSASGVLNAAVSFRKPCLASAGPGNLQTVIQRYGLGTWIEPDSAAAIQDGIARWLNMPPTPAWETYEQENSWQKNAELVLARMYSPRTT